MLLCSRVMDHLDLLIDLHLNNDRQGPGGDDQTRLAIDIAGLDREQPLEIADIGCGTGAASLMLARTLNARITGVDLLPAFVDRLGQRAEEAGLGDRISATVGDMTDLPFEREQFDVLWSEGAVYNMGLSAGLHAWRPFLKPGGLIALSELTWTSSTRPEPIEQHWASEYPGIATGPENLRTFEEAGFRPLGVFFLPDHCWTRNYYEPIRASFKSFLARHDHSEAAQGIVEAEETEMRLYERYGEWYGYGFYVARKVDSR